ncbi:MAG: hypothetical protein IBX69_02290 [Anaerolineales bacterium]|nr:hypothetical protein [Anaerolineales bacterium]
MSRLINQFYNVLSIVLFKGDALVEKLIGDAVIAFFTPGFGGEQHARNAIDAASKY